MKAELKGKYVPPSFSARLMDKWHRYTQGNKSAQGFVEKFDEFLIRCNAINTEGQAQIMSRFRAGLRDDLRTKLLAREITELEKSYVLVQDLDAAKTNSISKSQVQTTKPNLSSYSNRFQSQISSHKVDTKGKSIDNKGKGTDREFSKLTPTIKCYKCQGSNSGQNCHSQWGT